ncbi:MAG TPA: hypothetical protein VGA72_09015 [Anaerolineales bacterium]
MSTQLTNQQKPTLVQVIAWMTLASGIVNLFWGIIASLTALATIVGIVCVPFTILPTILGVFEIIYAAKLLSNPPQPVLPSTNIAVLEIVTILVGNVFSMVVGILALVFYNDLVVKDYFARLNGMPAPATTVVPVEPVSVPDPNPAPVMSEPAAAPADESPAPQPEESPDKPKSDQE